MNSENIIKNSLDKDVYHVFFVSSPIVEIIAFQVINTFNIPKEKIVIVLYRGYKVSLIDGECISTKTSILDRLLLKFFYFSWQGYKLRRNLEKKKKNFHLYTAWDFPVVVEILNSKYCIEQAYLEEGQMSYNPSELYTFHANRETQKIRLKKWRKSYKQLTKSNDIGTFLEFYNNKAFAFIGILPDVFPVSPENKRLLLTNLNKLKKRYEPRLTGVEFIGIMCSPRRLYPDKFEDGLKRLVSHLPTGSVIKLHPDFKSFGDLRENMILLLKELRGSEVSICGDDLILEIEMLHEKKQLIGSLTSLEKYSHAFGSEFNVVNLY